MQLLKRLMAALLLMLLLAFVKSLLNPATLAQWDVGHSIIANLQWLLLLAALCTTLIQWGYRATKKRDLVFGKALLLFFSLMFLLEGITWLSFRHPGNLPLVLQDSYARFYGNYGRREPQYDPACARYDSGLTYTLRRNARFDFSNYDFNTHYTTNALGLRDDSASLHKPAIICLGDSYTMGWGVEQSETFAAVLEQQTGYKVLNAGISSYGTAREMLSLRRMDQSALRYLVIQYCGNDVVENTAFINHQGRLPVMPLARYDSLVLAQRNRVAWYPLKLALSLPRYFARQWMDKVLVANKTATAVPFPEAAIKVQAQQMLQIIQALRPNNDSLQVIVFDATGKPPLEQRFVAALQYELRQSPQFDSLRNISVLDIAPHIRPDHCIPLDLHLNAEGHAVVASLLRDKIKALSQAP